MKPDIVSVFDILGNLLESVEQSRDLIRASGNAKAHDVETRMDMSARHVAVAEWGGQLESAWHAHDAALMVVFPGLDHATTITAAQSLVFGNAITALDMCASAGAMWCGAPLSEHGRESDLGRLIQRKRPAGDRQPQDPPIPAMTATRPAWAAAWLHAWVDALIADRRFAELWRKRDEQIHRIVQRSARVDAGAPQTKPTSHSTFGPTGAMTEPGVSALYADCIDLTRHHWIKFWLALATSATSRAS